MTLTQNLILTQNLTLTPDLTLTQNLTLTQIDFADNGFIIKTLFLWAFLVSQFILYLTINNSTSRNIGGPTDAWARPPTSNFGETVLPVHHKSLPVSRIHDNP